MNLKEIAAANTIWQTGSVRADQTLAREVQQRLTALGYQPGVIDGIWGNGTQAAYAAFAKANALKPEELSPKAAQILLGQPTSTPKPATPTPTPVPTVKPTTPTPAPPSGSPAPASTATPAPAPVPSQPPASAPAPQLPKFAPATQPLPSNLREIASGALNWQLDRITQNQALSKEVQQCLEALGHNPGPIDGLWGNGTQSAYASFVKGYQLKADECSPQAAQYLLEPVVSGILVTRPTQRLGDSDYRTVAQSIGCAVAAVRAVAEVEAAGSGFFGDGRPKILFEAHWFSAFTDSRYDWSNGDISSPSWNRALYIGGAGEWDRLYKASRLNREAALKAASWGLGQVMGFNHKAAGYSDVESFVRDMHLSEGKQLMAMFNFIKSNQLDRFLINRDWAGFALRYNGESYRENRYDEKLADAFKYWSSRS